MQFNSPGLLWLLFLCLIPIIIHLFRFKRYRKVEFTRVDLLKQITVKTGFGNKLRKLLIMTMRVLAIAALVFAFAGPFLPNKNNNEKSAKNKLVVFLDNSLSMGGEGSEGPIFEAAKNRARALVAEFSNEYSFYLLSHSIENTNYKALDKAEMLEEIDKLPIVNNAMSQNDVFYLINSIADEKSISAYISEFRKGFLEALPNDYLPSNSTFWLPVPAKHAENISIDSAWFYSPQLLPGQTLQLNVKLTNYGTEAATDISLRLLENEVVKGVTNTNIEAGKSKHVEIPFVAGEQGWKNVRLELPGDEFNFDDVFHLTYLVQKGSKGLVLNEKSVSPNLKALFSEGSGFKVDFMTPLQIVFDKLSENDFVVLDGITEASSGLIEEIAKYVETGGTLLVFPSTTQETNKANLILQRLQMGTFGEIVTQNVEADIWDLKDPLLYGIFDKSPKNIDLPKVYKYYKIQPSQRQISFWKLKNGSTLASRVKRGAGNVFITTLPLNKEFSNLAMHPLFVPYMLRIASFKDSETQLYYETGTEEMLLLKNVKPSPNEIWSLKNKSEELIPEIVLRDKQAYLVTNGSLLTEGIYSLYNSKQEEQYRFAFNLPRQESVGGVESLEELKSKAESVGVKLISEKPEFIASKIKKEGEGSPLWKYFILSALLFLVVEMILIRIWKV